MKVILTGVTGFIGSELLSQCLASPQVTSIIALSRRPLPSSQLPSPHISKLEVIIMSDFTKYTPEILSKLEDADAAIWCMGTTAAIREIEVDYPLAFMKALGPIVSKREKPFRYLHCSGRMAEKDQEKPLLFLQEGRRIKGTAENEVLAFEKDPELKGKWESYIVKPSIVMRKSGGGMNEVMKKLGRLAVGSVRVDELAAAMRDIVKTGEGTQFMLNDKVVERGSKVLKSEQ